MVKIQEVSHRLGRPHVVVDHDRRGPVAQRSFHLDGRAARLQGESNVPLLKRHREDDAVHLPPQQGLNSCSFPIRITAGVEDQHIVAPLGGRVLDPDRHLGEERVGQDAVEDVPKDHRSLVGCENQDRG